PDTLVTFHGRDSPEQYIAISAERESSTPTASDLSHVPRPVAMPQRPLTAGKKPPMVPTRAPSLTTSSYL
ncbi:unnamed protein product, partial [Heterosigma akashiwo]